MGKEAVSSAMAVGVSFVVYALTMSTTRLASLLFVAAIPRYGVDRGRASFPFILCYATRNSVGPLIGYFSKRFGIRAVSVFGCLLSSVAVGGCYFAEDIVTVTILWGVVYGFGFAFSTLSIPHFLSLHFSKHLDKANGISLTGDSAGYFFLSLLTEYSLVTYGLSGTYLIISGAMLHSVPIALLLKLPKGNCGRNQVEDSTKKQEAPKTSNEPETVDNRPSTDCKVTKATVNPFRVFLNPVYILIVIIQSSMLYLLATTYIILIDVARDHDVSPDDEVYLFLAVSATDFAGRLLLGSVTDAGYITKLNFSALCYAALGLLYALCVWIKGSVMMMTFAFCFGLILGGLHTVNTGLVSFYIDKEYHSVAVPSRLVLYPPVSFSQAPLIGFFRDAMQSYDGLFYVLTGICCMSSIICLLIPYIISCKKNREKTPLNLT